jgi:hypothetical protein
VISTRLRAEPVPPALESKPAQSRRAARPWTRSQVVLPSAAEAARPMREVTSQGYTVRLDLSRQVLFIETPKEHSWRGPGEYRTGDVVAVTSDKARVMSGKRALAVVPKDRLLAVTEVEGEWLRTAVAVGDEPQPGWIHVKEVRLHAEEPALHPTLAGLATNEFAPAAVLAQKAKQFDDGLYAAVELAAQDGLGRFAGKKALLTGLVQDLTRGANAEGPLLTLLAACSLGEIPAYVPTQTAIDARVRVPLSERLVKEFRDNPLVSKPLGFYTWSKPLASIFQQDRMLQSELTDAAGIEALVRSLHGSTEMRSTYETYLELISRLTNPPSKPDLRGAVASLDEGQYTAPAKGVRFFPPSTSRESELVERLFADRPVPDGFSLADELVARVRSGEIDLTPRPDSGWYDYQTWALEPMALPDRMPEAERLQLGEEYRKQLLELFKGVLALTRETHVKQLDVPLAAAEAPPPKERVKIAIAPELCAEPLASFYLRRAVTYQFIRKVLVDTFGSDSLAEMHRLTAEGPVERNLAEELDAIEAIFHGAYVAVSRQLGMPTDENFAVGSGQGDDGDAAAFLDWAANPDHDIDLARDARMMVPVFYDQLRRQTKVWVFLGWASQGGWISFSKPPAAVVVDEAGQVVDDDGPELVYHSAYRTFVYPVMAEIYVDRLLDRDEFRHHCDLHVSREVIMQALEESGPFHRARP